jgi:ribosomal protein S18 acetylase RimI-like enzyme
MLYGVRVRPACLQDGPKILAMLMDLASFEGAAHPPRLSHDVLEQDVFGPSPSLRILVAQDGALTLVGVIVYFQNYSTWEGRVGIHITDLWVEPEARGQGVGEALIQEVIALHPHERIDAFVLRENKARWFYEHLGFVEQKEWCLYRRVAGSIH